MHNMPIKPNIAFYIAARIGQFLIEKDLYTYSYWSGKVSKKDQMKYFGFYLGRGKIHVDGTEETIEMTKKVCFGQDWTTVRGIDCKAGTMFDNDPDGLTGIKFHWDIGIRS